MGHGEASDEIGVQQRVCLTCLQTHQRTKRKIHCHGKQRDTHEDSTDDLVVASA
jgi:hypothetical protein